jgi:hypothetical protein
MALLERCPDMAGPPQHVTLGVFVTVTNMLAKKSKLLST